MRKFTHDELHVLTDENPSLKAKSYQAHSLPQNTSEEKEIGKLQMMEIYAEAVECRQVETAKEFVKKVFTCLREGKPWETMINEYASQRLCHSPVGNDYMCFCDEKKDRWVKFLDKVVNEDETGIILEATDGSGAVWKHKTGDYRKDESGNVEIRIGSYAEFIKYPKGCEINRPPKE